MKLKLYICIILIIISNHKTFAQNSCLPGYTTFNSQVSVDDFLSNNPSCTEIEGDILIQGSDINSLAAFSNIVSIDGDLTIRICDSLPDLEGLNNLTTIGGRLYLDQNPSLNSLSALNNLSSVGDELTIRICDSLLILEGLDNLTSIGGELYLDQNPSLNSLSGLNSLTSIGAGLTIRICDSLPNLEGLNNLSSIGGEFYLDQNPSLNSLSALNNLASVGGSFTIRICDMLANLDGLNNLQSINGKLYIRNNDALENLDGIQNIDPNTIMNSLEGSTDLTISINPSLSQCSVESICNFLLLPNKTHSISNNATGCDNSDEIINNCTGLGLESINNSEGKINVFPNPSINSVSFTISDDLNIKKIVLVNSMGMEIKKLNTRENTIDISYLSDGCYVLLFYTDKSIYRRIFIKES